MPPKVKFKRLSARAVLPRYMTDQAAGMDLVAAVESEATLEPRGGRVAIPTGWAIELPAGYEGQIRPRSGLAARHGVTVTNAPGTLDSDFRGQVMVLLVNLGAEPYTIRHGDRVAQLVVAPVVHAEVEEVTELSSTPRGEGGFGHTG